MIGKNIPHPKTSSIEEEFAYNKYDLNNIDASIVEIANAKFYETIKDDIPVLTYPDIEKEGYRWWECLGHKIPCGGVHVERLSEIGTVKITTSSKKGNFTIKFMLER